MFERFRDAAATDGVAVGEVAWPLDDATWNQAAFVVESALLEVFVLGFDRADQLVALAFEDVLEEAANHPDDTATSLWFEFQLADAGTQLALAHRRFDRLLIWLIRPLVESVEIPSEVDHLPIGRVRVLALGIWADDPRTRTRLRRYALSWLRALFHYVHRINHLVELAEELTSPAFAMAMDGRIGSVPMAITLYGWLIATSPAPDQRRSMLLRLIVAAEANGSVDIQTRVDCALTIASTPIDYFGDQSATAAERRVLRTRVGDHLLRRWSDDLVSHQRLQFLVSLLGDQPEQLHDRHGEVLAAIDEYTAALDAAAQQQGLHAAYYQRGRLFGLLAPIVRTALLADNVDQATALLARWRGVPAGAELRDVLFHLSAEPNGTHWIWRGHNRSADNPEAMVASVLAANRFLHVHTTVANAPEVTLEPLDDPSRFGYPDPQAAPAFANAAAALIRPDLIGDDVPQIAEETSALVPVPGQTLPWQALLARADLPVWPISASLRVPESDRPVRRIVVWDSGEVWSAERELDALRVITDGAADVTVKWFRAGSAEQFVDAYADPGVDVFWIVAHGDYDHYSPHQSRIPVNASEHVTLNDLLTIQPTWRGRRLLMLNSCDGAAAATFGGPTDFGFAPSLASSKQAVISHLWPVESLYVAPAFGALLMAGIVAGKQHLDAFRYSLGHMVRGWHVVADELVRGGATELADSVRYTSVDLDDVSNWGTSAFFV